VSRIFIAIFFHDIFMSPLFANVFNTSSASSNPDEMISVTKYFDFLKQFSELLVVFLFEHAKKAKVIKNANNIHFLILISPGSDL